MEETLGYDSYLSSVWEENLDPFGFPLTVVICLADMKEYFMRE